MTSLTDDAELKRLEDFFKNSMSFQFVEGQGWSHFRIKDGTVNLYAAEISLMFELMMRKGYISQKFQLNEGE